MSKAYFKCGNCEELVTVIGRNRRTADYIASKKEEEGELCHDCWKEEQNKEHAKDAEENAKVGLVNLTGSEKQIAWAESIRKRKIADIQKWVDGDCFEEYVSYSGKTLQPEDPRTPKLIETMKRQDSASWWIDRRDEKVGYILDSLAKVTPTESDIEEKESALEAEIQAKIEATVRPEKPITETIAEIQLRENTVLCFFPEKRDDFREIVKFNQMMHWNGAAWEREIRPDIHGSPQDRAANLGHVLLSEGFPVRIFDESTRLKVLSGDYNTEQKRWIMAVTSGKYAGWFTLKWARGDDFYQAARLIHGSKYIDRHVIAPSDQFEEVLDFAQMHGFSLSSGAEKLIEEAKIVKEKALITHIKSEEPKKEKVDIKPKKLDIPENVEVDDELRD